MATAPLPLLRPTRAARRPFKPNLHYLTALLVIALSIIVGVVTLGGSGATRAVLVATRDRPAGTILQADDFTVAQVRVDDALYAAALPGAAAARLVGQQLAEPVHAGQLIVRAQLATGPRLGPDQVAISIGVKNESAAGGAIAVGDTVGVLVTTKTAATSQTSVVVDRAIVYGVGRDESVGSLGPDGTAIGGPVTSLTLIVRSDQALQLAAARQTGALDVVLLPPGGAPLREGSGLATPAPPAAR